MSAALPAAGRLYPLASGLAMRVRLVIFVAATVVLLDHAAKLAAAGLQPESYMHNPEPMDWDWVLLLPALALLFRSRLSAFLYGVWLGGGASNVIDVYVWPGGVPDFIPLGEWIWNPADFAIYGAGIALLAYPVWRLFVVARTKYPERERHAVPPRPEPDFAPLLGREETPT